MTIELTPIEPSPIDVSTPGADPGLEPRHTGDLANGDKVRLRAAHSVTGILDDVHPNRDGEISISWDHPHAGLDGLRLPAEVEHLPPPGFTLGERIWVPATVETAEPDSDGDVIVRLDALNPRLGGEGDVLYLNHADYGHRVLRPEQS